MSLKILSFPAPLKKGAAIGVVSPARATDVGQLTKATQLLEQQGYKVVVHPHHCLSAGQWAGDDAARLQGLHDMFADPAIDAIICGRGGNGAMRLLDKVDYTLIARNPKLFVGYSDITCLLHAIRRECGLVTYHGPMMSSFGKPHDARTLADFLQVAERAGQETVLQFPDVEILSEGTAEGALIGGNMSLLQNLIGTKYDWDIERAILFIEDVGEPLYRLDRMLHHFHYAGKLQSVAAVLFGEMIDLPADDAGDVPYGRTIQQILRDNLPPDIPVAMNVPCGHGSYRTMLPVGGMARVELAGTTAKLTLLAA